MTYSVAWIDDDIPIIGSLVRFIQDEGNEVHFFDSLEKAFERLCVLQKVDLILMDLIIAPGETLNKRRANRGWARYPGIDFLRILRGEKKISTPVILFTVVTDEKLPERIEGLGVKRIINKPITPTYLKEVVEDILAENRNLKLPLNPATN